VFFVFAETQRRTFKKEEEKKMTVKIRRREKMVYSFI
jgi:hypothetical protein